MYDLFGNLKDRRRHRGGQLSGGEQQMLAVGQALLTNPSLLMDEPSGGLAPVLVERMGEIITALRRSGLPIFLVEQNYGLAIDSADVIYILSNGQVVWTGTARYSRETRWCGRPIWASEPGGRLVCRCLMG